MPAVLADAALVPQHNSSGSSGPQLHHVLQLVLPLLPKPGCRAVRLACRQLQQAHDAAQHQLTVDLAQLAYQGDLGTAAPAALEYLLAQGHPMPFKLTLDNDSSTLPASSIALAPLVAVVGQRVTSLELRSCLPHTEEGIAALAAAAPAVTELIVACRLPSPVALRALLRHFGPALCALDFSAVLCPETPDCGNRLSHHAYARAMECMDLLGEQLGGCGQLRCLKLRLHAWRGASLPLEWLTGLTGLHTLELTSPLLAPGRGDLAGLTSLVGLTRLKLGEVAARETACSRYEGRKYEGTAIPFPLASLENLSALRHLQSLELMGSDAHQSNPYQKLIHSTDLTSLGCLTLLTRLKLGLATCSSTPATGGGGVHPQRRSSGDVSIQEGRASLAAALQRLPRLRELLLPYLTLDAACLLALRDKPVTRLAFNDVCVPSAAGDASPADSAGSQVHMPRTLQALNLARGPVPICKLAALATGGLRSLVHVSVGRCPGLLPLCLMPDGPDTRRQQQQPQQQVVPTAARDMRAAAALLVGRLLPLEAATCSAAELAVHAWECSASGPAHGMAGPHAPWLRELAPLAGAIRWGALAGLALHGMVLADGDLAALAGALPALEALTMTRCSWPATALLELAPLERLRHLRLELPRAGCRRPLAAVATLQELLVLHLPSLELLTLRVPGEGIGTAWQLSGAGSGVSVDCQQGSIQEQGRRGGAGVGAEGQAWGAVVYECLLQARASDQQVLGQGMTVSTECIEGDPEGCIWVLKVVRAGGAARCGA